MKLTQKKNEERLHKRNLRNHEANHTAATLQIPLCQRCGRRFLDVTFEKYMTVIHVQSGPRILCVAGNISCTKSGHPP